MMPLLFQPVSDLMMTMVGTAPSHCWWKAPAWKLWSLALKIVVQAWLGLPTQLLRTPEISWLATVPRLDRILLERKYFALSLQ